MLRFRLRLAWFGRLELRKCLQPTRLSRDFGDRCRGRSLCLRDQRGRDRRNDRRRIGIEHDALRLLTLPRTIGELDGETVTVQNGRYGPYVKKGTDSRSLDSEDQLFTLSLAEAKEMFAQPKTRGRGRADG
jgi:hypothetical protein